MNCLLLFFLLQLNFATPIYQNKSKETIKFNLNYSSSSMYYIKDLNLGTPNQSIRNIILDTGSSDLVLSSSTFNSEDSSTFENSNEDYPMQYGSTEAFNITMVSDTLSGPNWSLNDYTFGISDMSNLDSFYGILGVGYHTREAMNDYENLPLKFKSKGLIKTSIYSVNGQPTNPSVIFGGVDSSIYIEPLIKTPIAYEIGFKATRTYHNVLAVTVNAVKLGSTIISNQNLIYTIDSGANLLAVTEPIYNNIVALLGDHKSFDDTPYFKLSAIYESTVTVSITGFEVAFPLLDLLEDTKVINGEKYSSLRLSIVNIGVDSYEGTLPNVLMKYYYTVFDLENNQILLAKYRADPGPESILAIINPKYFPVSTTSAPSLETYSVVYQNDNEVTIKATSTTVAKNSCYKR